MRREKIIPYPLSLSVGEGKEKGRTRRLWKLAVFLTGGILLFGCQRIGEQIPITVRSHLYGGPQRNSDYSAWIPEFQTDFLIPHYWQKDRNYRVDPDEGVLFPPIFASADTVYLVSRRGVIQQLVADSLQKQFWLNAKIAAPLTLNEKGVLFGVTTDGAAFALLSSGEILWRHSVESPEQAGWYGEPLVLDSLVLFPLYSGKISAFSQHGQLLWQYSTNQKLLPLIAADSNGNIYCIASRQQYPGNDTLISLTATGKVRWKTAFPNTRLFEMPVVCDSLVYVIGSVGQNNRTHYLYVCDNRTGVQLRKIQLDAPPKALSAGANSVVVACYQSTLGAIQSTVYYFENWRERWKIRLPGKVNTPPLLSQKNIAIFAYNSYNSRLFIVQRTTGSIIASQPFSDYPLLNLLPAVTTAGNIALGMVEKNGWLEIGAPAVFRLLPY